MDKIVRLTEEETNRIVKRLTKRIEKDNSKIYDDLRNTELYKILDEITEIRYVEGKYPNNDSGGLRLFVNNGYYDTNFSINGYNIGKAFDFLKYLIETEYLKGQILKEISIIKRKTSIDVINTIISLILEREPIN